MRTARGRRKPTDERGAVAVFVALVTCFTLLPLAAFAVDLGMQRVARRDAQAIADMVALDLGRQLDGRTLAQIQPTLQQRADASAARNAGGVSRDTRVRAELGTVAPEKYATDPAGYFTPTTSAAAVPTAVRGSMPAGVLVSGLLSAVLNQVLVPIVNPLITAVNTLVLNPLTQLLGIKAGGAQLLVRSPISCGRPALVG